MELLMQSAVSVSMKTCSTESQVTSIRIPVQHVFQLQLLSTLYLEAIANGFSTISSVPMQVDELVVEISDLRVRLAEAKGEKEELNGKLEVVLEHRNFHGLCF